MEDAVVNILFQVRLEKMKGQSRCVSYNAMKYFSGEAVVPTETAWLWSALSC